MRVIVYVSSQEGDQGQRGIGGIRVRVDLFSETFVRAQRLNPRDLSGWLMAGAMAIAAKVDED